MLGFQVGGTQFQFYRYNKNIHIYMLEFQVGGPNFNFADTIKYTHI